MNSTDDWKYERDIDSNLSPVDEAGWWIMNEDFESQTKMLEAQYLISKMTQEIDRLKSKCDRILEERNSLGEKVADIKKICGWSDKESWLWQRIYRLNAEVSKLEAPLAVQELSD